LDAIEKRLDSLNAALRQLPVSCPSAGESIDPKTRAQAAQAEPAGPAAEARKEVDQKVIAQARSIVNRGLASGRWTAVDRSELRPLLRSLPEETRNELMSSIARALNNDQLKLDEPGPPI
jgi:hypothetical protein